MPIPHLDPLQERLLVVQAQGGDLGAFSTLVTLYERRLMYFLKRFVLEPDQVLDILQEVWLEAFRRLPSLRAPEAFRVWLYRIAHDRGVTRIRRERREEEILVDQAIAEDVLEIHEFERLETADMVRRALDELPEHHRIVLVLRFLEDMNVDDLSSALRLPPGTVKSRLHYAKLALRQKLKEQGYEDP